MTVFELTDEDPADARLLTQVFLSKTIFAPKGLDPIPKPRSCIALHSVLDCVYTIRYNIAYRLHGQNGNTTSMSQERANKRLQLAKSEQISIFKRDGWLCRWCGRPVIFGPVMKYLEIDLRSGGHDGPLAYYHAHWSRATAPLLDELGAVLDHVHAISLEGPCEPANLATTCAKCNGRKGSIPIEEWARRPRRRPIKSKDGEPAVWDGFSALFVVLANRHCSKLTAAERAWLKAIVSSLSMTEEQLAVRRSNAPVNPVIASYSCTS